MCEKKAQLIRISYLCNGLIDCIDRSDESNCFSSPQTIIQADFIDCKINTTNNYKNHSEENADGFQCGVIYCLDTDIWCSQKKYLDKESLTELSSICPDQMKAINNKVLCTNKTFWQTRPCQSGYLRCKGNFPGQCALVQVKAKHLYTGNSCRDKSDYFAYGELRNYSLFECSNRNLIHRDLFCDGNNDCSDKSDEDENRCLKCPPDLGYPAGKHKSATFSCRHRYTKQWICAVPCDGIDDLCENFGDEDCSSNTTINTLTILIGLLLLTNMLGLIYAKLTEKNYQTCEEANTDEINCMFKNKMFIKKNSFRKIHQSKFYHQELKHFYHLISSQPNDQKHSQHLKSFVQSEISFHGNSLHEVLLCLKNNAGNSQLSSDVHELLFPSPLNFVSKISSFIRRSSCIANFNLKFLTTLQNWLISMAKIALFYFDLIKDIVLLVLLVQKVNLDKSYLTFEIQIIFFMLLSISFPHAVTFAHWIYLLVFKKVERNAGLFLLNFPVFIPAVGLYMIGNLKSRLELHFDFKTYSKWLKWMKRCSFYKTVEATFESSVQVLILMFVIFLKNSETKTVYGLENVITNDEAVFLGFSAAWSLVSLVLSDVDWQNSLKNYYIGLIGHCLLGLYFLSSILSRVFAITLYFAPSMGFFNLMYHWKLGKKETAEPSPLYDTQDDGFQLILKDVWERIAEYSELTFFDLEIYYIIFLSFILIHNIIVLTLKLFFSSNFSDSSNLARKLYNVVTNMFSPKIYQDWDVGISTLADVKRNFEKVKKEMRAMLVLFAAEHLLMCVPIWILSYNIYKRNIYLDEYFPQLDEEIWSTKLAYSLSVTSPFIFIFVPFAQYSLFILYNKFGHPWGKLLQDDLILQEWSKDGQTTLQELMSSNYEATSADQEESGTQSEVENFTLG